MGLSIGSDEFESLALGDTPLEALMLGDVELWSAEPAQTPYNYSIDIPTRATSGTYVQVASHTIVGYSGAVTIKGTALWSYGGSTGVQFRKNNIVLAHNYPTSTNPNSFSTGTTVVPGDQIAMWVRHTYSDSTYSRLSSGTFSITTPA